jgi:hypothetical protein
MVCSMPEKCLAALGEYCNEVTGTYDPGMWSTWSAVCQNNASSPQESTVLQRGDWHLQHSPQVVDSSGLQCARIPASHWGLLYFIK